MPTQWQTFVRENIGYDSETGKFSWLKRRLGVQFHKEPGCINSTDGYRMIGVGRKVVKAHKLAWFLHYNEWPVGELDHINRDPVDNRIVNLRLATRQQNSANRKMGYGNYHGFKGMSYDPKRKKWATRIRVDGVLKHLGRFDDIVDAAKAYDVAAKKYFGDYACLNLPWETS